MAHLLRSDDLIGKAAYLFDLDGVLTPTVEVHMRAWARMFGQVFTDYGVAAYTDADYFAYLDGKPRYAGVADLLASRGIELPYGDPADGADARTVCGLGNKKNDEFSAVLASDGVQPYAGSLEFVRQLAAADVSMAVVSSSRNAVAVLRAASLDGFFPIVVDGLLAAKRGLAGKPAPDTYRFAADQLGVPYGQAVVIEDAPSGVAAGRAGSFGLVLGVNRGAGTGVLLDSGADVVVDDLAEAVPVFAAANGAQ
ncbi:HAD family hydrolase [Rarobacter incanus]|nr:HAD-IA family hydrolase [Rarobacter incanus]